MYLDSNVDGFIFQKINILILPSILVKFLSILGLYSSLL